MTATDDLMALLAKVGDCTELLRAHAAWERAFDALDECPETAPWNNRQGLRIAEKRAREGYMLLLGIAAPAIVAAVNFCRAELPALIEREAALRGAGEKLQDEALSLADRAANLERERDALREEVARLRASVKQCSGSCGPVFPIDAALGASHDAK